MVDLGCPSERNADSGVAGGFPVGGGVGRGRGSLFGVAAGGREGLSWVWEP